MSTANAVAFTGREADTTGLYFYRARYYDPRSQRFIAENPLGQVAGVNLYLLAGNAPTVYVDPLGLDRQPKTPQVPTFGPPLPPLPPPPCRIPMRCAEPPKPPCGALHGGCMEPPPPPRECTPYIDLQLFGSCLAAVGPMPNSFHPTPPRGRPGLGAGITISGVVGTCVQSSTACREGGFPGGGYPPFPWGAGPQVPSQNDPLKRPYPPPPFRR
jgi:RHS repeat-associated protein